MAKPLCMFVLLVVLVSGLGCASPPIVSVRTTADLHHTFAAPATTSVNAKVWRQGTGDDAGHIANANELTLEERNFLAGVEHGLAQAGFTISNSDDVAYTMLATMGTATGVYDTFRRVPVIESTTGHVHTSEGFRSYSATTTSDYIVPERRPYVHRIVSLAAVPADAVQGADSLSPELPGVVWRGRLASDADVIDTDLAHHVAVMLESWGASSQRDVKYKPAK
jgi:hypothetical protein